MKFATYHDKGSWIKNDGTLNSMESLTDQSFRSDVEIESLLINYRGTPRTPVYDLNNHETSSWTFEDWQNQKAMIERKFLHLDEQTRNYFGSPQEFFKYCSNPRNYILTKDGLAEKEVVETPQVIPEVESKE